MQTAAYTGLAAWQRLVRVGGPVVDMLRTLSEPERASRLAEVVALVAEDATGEPHAYWLLWKAYHFEPLYAKDGQAPPPVAKALLTGAPQLLAALGIEMVYAFTESEGVTQMATRLGFAEVPGRAFYMRMDDGRSRRRADDRESRPGPGDEPGRGPALEEDERRGDPGPER